MNVASGSVISVVHYAVLGTHNISFLLLFSSSPLLFVPPSFPPLSSAALQLLALGCTKWSADRFNTFDCVVVIIRSDEQRKRGGRARKRDRGTGREGKEGLTTHLVLCVCCSQGVKAGRREGGNMVSTKHSAPHIPTRA